MSGKPWIALSHHRRVSRATFPLRCFSEHVSLTQTNGWYHTHARSPNGVVSRGIRTVVYPLVSGPWPLTQAYASCDHFIYCRFSFSSMPWFAVETYQSFGTQVQMTLDNGGLWDCPSSHIFDRRLSPRTLAEFPPKENERWEYRVFACGGARNRCMFMSFNGWKCR